MSTLPGNFIFRLNFPCRRFREKDRARLSEIKQDPESFSESEFLDDSYELPFWRHHPLPAKLNSFQSAQTSLSFESSRESFSGNFFFRVAWHPSGLVLTTSLSGKERPLQSNRSQLERSDGLRFCLDTRDVRDVHRGTRFCHRFLFLPQMNDSRELHHPVAFWLPIHRAKAHPNEVDVSRFLLRSTVVKDGYTLSAFLPAQTLTGYDPEEHRQLGFHFSLFDTELGTFDLQHSSVFPVDEDPSLWAGLELQPEP